MHPVSHVSSTPPAPLPGASQPAFQAPGVDADGDHDGGGAREAAKPEGVGGLLDTTA